MEDYCVVCGVAVPEGKMICPNCENEITPIDAYCEQLLAEKPQRGARRIRWPFGRGRYDKPKGQK